jgi:hypothetical protein
MSTWVRSLRMRSIFAVRRVLRARATYVTVHAPVPAWPCIGALLGRAGLGLARIAMM